MGSGLWTKQTREWAAIGAEGETVLASRWTATSGQNRKSGWTEAVHRVSAPAAADAMTRFIDLHHPQ
jgi:hypothetical protein